MCDGGGLNIDLLSTNADVDGFVDMMRTHQYLQTVTDVTHPGGDLSTSSLIDMVEPTLQLFRWFDSNWNY